MWTLIGASESTQSMTGCRYCPTVVAKCETFIIHNLILNQVGILARVAIRFLFGFKSSGVYKVTNIKDILHTYIMPGIHTLPVIDWVRFRTNCVRSVAVCHAHVNLPTSPTIPNISDYSLDGTFESSRTMLENNRLTKVTFYVTFDIWMSSKISDLVLFWHKRYRVI